jgi:hypothetical protein
VFWFSAATAERAKPPYGRREVFNDYLEMVLQFGYVSLWSDHFPLAPLFSILHNMVRNEKKRNKSSLRSPLLKVHFHLQHFMKPI